MGSIWPFLLSKLNWVRSSKEKCRVLGTRWALRLMGAGMKRGDNNDWGDMRDEDGFRCLVSGGEGTLGT